MAAAARWRAWYADGRRFSSRETAPENLPAEGLVCVVVYYAAPYKDVFHGEYTWHRSGQWGTARCEFDAQVYGDLVFPGELMPEQEWLALQAEAMASTWE